MPQSLPGEGQVFLNLAISNATPEGIPYRELSRVAIFDSEGQLVNLLRLVEDGPFIATGVAPTLIYVNRNYWDSGVQINPIIEYSFEYPYGGHAVVWLRSEKAFYCIKSASDDYRAIFSSIVEGATLAGHMINSMLNIPLRSANGQVIKAASELSRISQIKVIELIKKHRKFILHEIRAQETGKLKKFRIMKALQTDQSWEKEAIRLKKNLTSASPPSSPIWTGCSETDGSCSSVISESSGIFQPKVDQPSPTSIPQTPIVAIESNVKLKKSTKKSGQSRHKNVKPKSMESPITVGSLDIAPVTINKGKRTTLSQSLLPAQFIKLKLPRIHDQEFKCPFCELRLFKNGKEVIVSKLLAHIETTHECPSEAVIVSRAEFNIDSGKVPDDGAVSSWPERDTPLGTILKRDALLLDNIRSSMNGSISNGGQLQGLENFPQKASFSDKKLQPSTQNTISKLLNSACSPSFGFEQVELSNSSKYRTPIMSPKSTEMADNIIDGQKAEQGASAVPPRRLTKSKETEVVEQSAGPFNTIPRLQRTTSRDKPLELSTKSPSNRPNCSESFIPSDKLYTQNSIDLTVSEGNQISSGSVRWRGFPADIETSASNFTNEFSENFIRPVAKIVELLDDPCCWRCGASLNYDPNLCARCQTVQE